MRTPDIVIVGGGPNGLTAGVLLAQAGLSVVIVEAGTVPGGGCRSAELTLPGFVHDICSAIHPMAVLSPVFRRIGLEKLGVNWVWSSVPLAHPLPDGEVAVLEKSLSATAARLGPDGAAWERLLGPFADSRFIDGLLQPMWQGGAASLGRKLRFGLAGLQPAERIARERFRGNAARALFAGCAAHSILALNRAGTAAFGMVLALSAHIAGWPCARGGSQAIANALARAFTAAGGELRMGMRVTSLGELPEARAILFDLSPRQIAALCAGELPPRFHRRYSNFKHGSGVFKIDWALDGPIPWRNPECAGAATVHVGGAFEDVLSAESDVAHGRAPSQPFVLVAQPSQIDPSRSPAGKHTGWAYCHVPAGCAEDMTSRIEMQVERFAPGFRDRILARHTLNPAAVETHNPTMIGGDIAGGDNGLLNFLFRPVPRWNPYATPNPRLFICSSSTPPGGGVHGMCGYFAARTVLQRVFGKSLPG
ncbi:MAG: NAD(P)/FAD-dependent oxidoreductase [Opitutaceae bacterium]|nr:NAD(P)/FAD-dependent oxidoreductase [Opitutaceae bacterium]